MATARPSGDNMPPPKRGRVCAYLYAAYVPIPGVYLIISVYTRNVFGGAEKEVRGGKFSTDGFSGVKYSLQYYQYAEIIDIKVITESRNT